MARKTVKIEDLIHYVNHSLCTSVASQDARFGMIAVLEQVLHDTGNYKGFMYLNKSDIPYGETPGIQTDENGEILPYPERFNGTDESRRKYY